jgi:hypothetical protein
MAFTFDLSLTGESLIVSQIRLFIGDKTENGGILPDGANLQDDEILTFYAQEGNHQRRAAAAALESAAASWSVYAGRYRLGPEDHESRQADLFAAQAQTLRDRYGFTDDGDTDESGKAFVVQVLPVGKEL